jgi:hypothetical protein
MRKLRPSVYTTTTTTEHWAEFQQDLELYGESRSLPGL